MTLHSKALIPFLLTLATIVFLSVFPSGRSPFHSQEEIQSWEKGNQLTISLSGMQDFHENDRVTVMDTLSYHLALWAPKVGAGQGNYQLRVGEGESGALTLSVDFRWKHHRECQDFLNQLYQAVTWNGEGNWVGEIKVGMGKLVLPNPYSHGDLVTISADQLLVNLS